MIQHHAFVRLTPGVTSPPNGVCTERLGNTRGFSLIEVLVALTIFSTALLALSRAGFVTSQTLHDGQSYMAEWTVAQSKLDSLSTLGWAALDGESGSDNVRGSQVTWNVDGTNPRRIILVVQRRVLARVRADTFTTYVANVP